FDTDPRTLINVNFPALPPDEVKGVRVCRQGLRDYGRLRIGQRTDPRGYEYYWFGLGPMMQTPGHSTDLEAITDGYVTVSPLHLDLTHDPSLDALHKRFAATPCAQPGEGFSDSRPGLPPAFAPLTGGRRLVRRSSQPGFGG